MKEIKNAVITKATLGIDDGPLMAWLTLDYGGSGQGFGGYVLALSTDYTHHSPERESVFCGVFLRRCLEVAGVVQWSALPGKTVRAAIEDGLVAGIGHIIKDDWFFPRDAARPSNGDLLHIMGEAALRRWRSVEVLEARIAALEAERDAARANAAANRNRADAAAWRTRYWQNRAQAAETDRNAAFARGKAEGIEAAAKDLESECWGPGRCTAITLKDGSCIEQFCPHRSAANIRALSPAAEQEKARELKEDLGDGRWADVEPAALSEAPTDGK